MSLLSKKTETYQHISIIALVRNYDISYFRPLIHYLQETAHNPIIMDAFSFFLVSLTNYILIEMKFYQNNVSPPNTRLPLSLSISLIRKLQLSG